MDHDSRASPQSGVPDLPCKTINALYGALPNRQASFVILNSKRVSHGTFGVVYKAIITMAEKNARPNVVAVKKVFQDPRYKNRELQIIRKVRHPNVTILHYFFHLDEPTGHYLCLVMDFIPNNLYEFYKDMFVNNQKFPVDLLRVISYQIGLAIDYISSIGICHRDIKPTNLLYHSKLRWIKLCDFGSAKELVAGEKNVSYICSRHYRAPELILGLTDYTFAIDVWSVGCVIAELILGRPVFPGKSNANQLVWIMKVMGLPTESEIKAMVPDLQNRDFLIDYLDPYTLSSIIPNPEYAEAVDLITKMFRYDPFERLKSSCIVDHIFFEPIKKNASGKYKDIFNKPLFLSDALQPGNSRNSSNQSD